MNINTLQPLMQARKTGTVKEYAEYSGINYATLRGYAAEGKLVMVEVDRGLQPMFGEPVPGERLVDFTATDAALSEAGQRQVKGRAKFRGSADGAEARDVEYRKNLALARRRELELAQLEGKLVSAEEVKSLWVKVVSTVKAGVLRIPDRTAQQVAASSDLREVRTILERECEAVLKGISDEILSAGL